MRGGVKHIPETVVFGGILLNHFGHAVLECLSRLWLVIEGGAAERIAFLPLEEAGDSPLKKLYGSFFELLDIDPKRIIYIEEPTQFDRVIVPDETVHSWGETACYKEKYAGLYEKMASRVEAKRAKKVYLTRSQFQKRDCINEEYFEEFYKRRGYTIIAPEQLSIKEQVAYMKGADEIACTLGTLSHLALFARPGTKLAILLRSPGAPLTPQMLINHAKRLDFYVIDATLSFLPGNRLLQSFLLGPSKYWKEYLDATGEEHSEEELEWDKGERAYEYMLRWCQAACTYEGWRILASFDSFDFLNTFSSALLDAPLKREDYPGAFKERVAALEAEVERLKAAIADPTAKRFEAEIEALQAENKVLKSEVRRFEKNPVWKLAKPLRKLWNKLGWRAQRKLRTILNKRLKIG